MALRRAHPDRPLSLWTRRAESIPPIAAALAGTVVTDDLPRAVDGADCVVLCTAPQSIEELCQKLSGRVAEDAVITDAGSVKSSIVRAGEAAFGPQFVGSHPMAGSEQSGFAAARPGLFEKAACIVTPTPNSSPDAVDTVRTLWRSVGCMVHELTPEDHDRLLARISHLPHAAAAALVHAVSTAGASVGKLAGNGYRDSTRIAAGPAPMWTEILLDNRAEVLAGLRDLQNQLAALEAALAAGDEAAVRAFLTSAAETRSQQKSLS